MRPSCYSRAVNDDPIYCISLLRIDADVVHKYKILLSATSAGPLESFVPARTYASVSLYAGGGP